MSNRYYHYSEEQDIQCFEPRVSPSFPDEPPMVWAIDEDHRPLYYFPRECPRIAYWKNEETTAEDVERFKVNTKMVIVIEEGWLRKLEDTVIYEYTFSGETFRCFDENAGYYTSLSSVKPECVTRLDGLIQRMLKEGVELRWVSSLWKVKEEVLASSLAFSMIRLRNAKY